MTERDKIIGERELIRALAEAIEDGRESEAGDIAARIAALHENKQTNDPQKEVTAAAHAVPPRV